MSSRTTLVGLLAASLLASGCATSRQLRKNTVRQSETVSEIYTQQVLDNLAMFAYDSNSLPFFAFPNQGTNQVTDKADASFAAQWGFEALRMFGIGAEREMQQAWTTEPISDPHKLALMRCAYQHALAAYVDGVVSRDCPKCSTILDEFYGDTAHQGGIDKKCLEQWGEDYGWLQMGCKKDIPKNCGCELVGEYCGTYVWVLPGDRDKLTQLTLAILDYATYEPAQPEKKQVVVTTERDENDNIIKITRQETFMEDARDKQGRVIYRRRMPSSQGGGILRLQQQLDTVR